MIKAIFQLNTGIIKGKRWYCLYRINNYGDLIPVKVTPAIIRKLLK